MTEPRPSCEIHARYSRGCSECHRTEIDAFRAEVAAALRKLEANLSTKAWATVADGKFSKIGHGINIAKGDLKATIAALGLEAEAQEEKCT